VGPGAAELTAGPAELALIGAVDELNQYQLAAGLRWGWWSESSPAIRPFTNVLDKPARPLPGEGCALYALGRADAAGTSLAFVSAIRIGRSEGQDAVAEAQWILDTLTREGIPASAVDLLLTGANGLREGDQFFQAVAAAFSRQAGRDVLCRAYKQGCGEHHSASAFGFLTAIGLVRGEIAGEIIGARPVRTVVMFTRSRTGTKGMCCIRA